HTHTHIQTHPALYHTHTHTSAARTCAHTLHTRSRAGARKSNRFTADYKYFRVVTGVQCCWNGTLYSSLWCVCVCVCVLCALWCLCVCARSRAESVVLGMAL